MMGCGSGWKGTVKEWVTTAGGGWEWVEGYSQGVGDYSGWGVGVGWKGTVKEWVTTAGGGGGSGWKGTVTLDVVRQVWVFDGFLHDRQQLGDGEYGTCFVVCQHVTQLRYTTRETEQQMRPRYWAAQLEGTCVQNTF